MQGFVQMTHEISHQKFTIFDGVVVALNLYEELMEKHIAQQAHLLGKQMTR